LCQSFHQQDWATSTLKVIQDWDNSDQKILSLIASNKYESISLANLILRAPLLYPPAIYCTGANYNDHAKEMSAEGSGVDKSTTQPYLFLKAGPHCVIGPGEMIRIPHVTNSLDWEGEFAVVIGKNARNVKAKDALNYVAGYTIMNDLSARNLSHRKDWPRWGIDWFGHKNFDGAAPMGPWITPANQISDYTKCHLKLWVNDEKKQDSLVENLIFNVEEIIEYLSERMTLMPGDVIATGTPSGVGRPKGTFLKAGDIVRIEISGIGVLENPVSQGI
jgi:2-keto-4-pentenoate hydratase/2-oxohepta-3-ene-1,7-dioic acid hydratase in catechol pathway